MALATPALLFVPSQLNFDVASHIASMTRQSIGLTLLLIGCAPPRVQLHPQPCPTGSVVADAVPPGLEPPRPAKLVIPPLPLPDNVRGSRSVIRLVVDTLGSVMQDSVTVCGITNSSYARRLAEAVFRMPFRPGRLAGHPVIAPAVIRYDF